MGCLRERTQEGKEKDQNGWGRNKPRRIKVKEDKRCRSCKQVLASKAVWQHLRLHHYPILLLNPMSILCVSTLPILSLCVSWPLEKFQLDQPASRMKPECRLLERLSLRPVTGENNVVQLPNIKSDLQASSRRPASGKTHGQDQWLRKGPPDWAHIEDRLKSLLVFKRPADMHVFASGVSEPMGMFC